MAAYWAAPRYPQTVPRVSEELATKHIIDEIIWSIYVNLDHHLGWLIIVAWTLEGTSSVIFLSDVGFSIEGIEREECNV